MWQDKQERMIALKVKKKKKKAVGAKNHHNKGNGIFSLFIFPFSPPFLPIQTKCRLKKQSFREVIQCTKLNGT